LGVLATLALFWGAVDIVGVSADTLLDYAWLSVQGVLLLALIAVPSGFLLRWLRRKP
tara:strand:- start:333 stop:503 length:171 start_codon:yes stop_codon:yes gene_type:complete